MEIQMKKIGIPLDPTLRRYNLIDLETGDPIACSHPVPDSALCDACYGRLIKEANTVSLWSAAEDKS